MSYVGRIIYDLDTESLIRKYLKSGVMEHGLKGKMVKIDEHLRTMLRKVIWKQWKTPRKQPWGLRKLGIVNFPKRFQRWKTFFPRVEIYFSKGGK